MIDLETIKSLRVWSRNVQPYNSSAFKKIIDSIESEINEKCIQLPMCDDGVIKIGDFIAKEDVYIGPIDALQLNADGSWEVFHDGNGWAVSGSEHHCRVKPKTLEEIVMSAIQYGYSFHGPGMAVSKKLDELCQEIRDLMKRGEL